MTTKELMNHTAKIKNFCKKTWVFTRTFTRKGIEFNIRVIKALKYSITH